MIFASSNKHKADEFLKLFDTKIFQIEFIEKKIKVVENGSSYQENAYIKSKKYYDIFKKPTFADDSGLEVDAIYGELGIYSSRFGGGNISFANKIELLLSKMQNKKNRKAAFHCALCFYLSPQEIYYFFGKLSGEIAFTARGENGFGYDPVFIPTGMQDKRLAELPEWKMKNSHRARAAEQAEKFFLGKERSNLPTR